MAIDRDRLKKLEKQMGMLTTHPVFSKFLQGGPFAVPESGMLLGGRRLVGGDPTGGQAIRWNATLERFEPQDLPTDEGGPPTGAAGGELGGTYPDPTVDATHSGSPHHTKYLDAAAIAAVEGEATLGLTGLVVFSQVAVGVTPTLHAHLATKEYIDSAIHFIEDYFF
ncbi:hypothetical protein LCGC14_2619930, partial [marine sediment metagenome]